jgi:hypothetical protein
MMVMNCELVRIRKKSVVTCFKAHGSTEEDYERLTIANNPAEIRTGYLPKARLDHYCYIHRSVQSPVVGSIWVVTPCSLVGGC